MNRIIKFRCWINNEMWYDFWLSNDEHEGVLLYDDNLNSPPVKCNKPYILMQFTGLHDKNGNEVYEGDVVKCSSGCPHEIVWGGGNGMPGWWLEGTIVDSMGDYIWMGKEEVMGNIYQNPELLK